MRMFEWNYEPPTIKKFERIPDGNYRLRIVAVEPKPETSESENYYVTFIYDVSGQDAPACSRLTFNENNPEQTNYILSIMANSFGINYSDVNVNDFTNWIGKYGAGRIEKKGKFNENQVRRFIKANEQYYLPAWVEGKIVESDDNDLTW